MKQTIHKATQLNEEEKGDSPTKAKLREQQKLNDDLER